MNLVDGVLDDFLHGADSRLFHELHDDAIDHVETLIGSFLRLGFGLDDRLEATLRRLHLLEQEGSGLWRRSTLTSWA